MNTAKLRDLLSDSLIRNSLYLMMATVIVSGSGFFFWILTTHLFTTEDIGLATTLISALNLVAMLSILGFNTVLVRFLPTSQQKNADISTGLIAVSLAAFCIGLLFVLFINIISPKLAFIYHPATGLAFALFCSLAALNILIESIFLAFRRTEFVLINNTIYSVAKLLFPLALIGYGAIGIFTAAALSHLVGVVLGVGILVVRFSYSPRFLINRGLIRSTWRYSSVNYIATICNLLPISMLPIIITNHLDVSLTAYFYISMMIGNLLYMIPWSASRSLFAESSYNEASLGEHVMKIIKINIFLLIPAILITIFFGRIVLNFFGKSYADSGIHFLWLVALAGIPVAFNSTFGALLQVKKDPKSLVVTNIFYGVTLIGLTYFFLPLGLIGIGWAWFFGNCAAAIVSGSSYFWGDAFYARLYRSSYHPRIIIWLYLRSVTHSVKNGFKSKTVLFYPDFPAWYHILYVVMHTAGYKMSNNPHQPYDVAYSFEDTTVKIEDSMHRHLRESGIFVNGTCLDISKVHVEKIFAEVFGYGMQIDPRTHVGSYVKKSDTNGTHSGQVLKHPTEPEEGFVYQKLINNLHDEKTVCDLRVLVINGNIPLVVNRYRSVDDRFDHTSSIRVSTQETELSPEEINNIRKFCAAFGVDYGELDILRDTTDGRIYIVDVNITCGGPRPGLDISFVEYEKFVQAHITNFTAAFLPT